MNPTIVRIKRPNKSPSIQSPFVAPEGFRSILPRRAPTQTFAGALQLEEDFAGSIFGALP
jgi:hypothetical protein